MTVFIIAYGSVEPSTLVIHGFEVKRLVTSASYAKVLFHGLDTLGLHVFGGCHANLAPMPSFWGVAGYVTKASRVAVDKAVVGGISL